MSFHITVGTGPLVATSIHAGHHLRSDVDEEVSIDEATRLREEDPYTDRLTDIAPNRIVVDTSRFEVDLNRPREKAVYRTADDAWGLEVWQRSLPEQVVRESLALYDRFYSEVAHLLDQMHEQYGKFVVLDLHSYCHRRMGPDAPPDDPQWNPDIIVGTSNIQLVNWSPLIDRFVQDLRTCDFEGRPLDVRKNVKFSGGNFVRWINRRCGDYACAIAVEFKKIFMDEWTGILNEPQLELLHKAIASTVPGLLEGLDR